MRGKAEVERSVLLPQRITPAYAGKSQCFLAGQPAEQDHPRMCGEKESMGAGTNGKVGSPPHVRGKVAVQSSNSHQFRITPACAGKSRAFCRNCVRIWDHPRMCGEKAASAVPFSPMAGSPPHVRGKGRSYMQVDGVPRITPACAGKSLKRGEFQTL